MQSLARKLYRERYYCPLNRTTGLREDLEKTEAQIGKASSDPGDSNADIEEHMHLCTTGQDMTTLGEGHSCRRKVHGLNTVDSSEGRSCHGEHTDPAVAPMTTHLASSDPAHNQSHPAGSLGPR